MPPSSRSRASAVAAPDMYSGALAQDPSGLRGDLTEEVDLEFDHGVSNPGGEHGVDGTAHRGVE